MSDPRTPSYRPPAPVPPAPPVAPTAPAPTSAPEAPAPRGYYASGPFLGAPMPEQRIAALMSSTSRVGRWTASPRISAIAVMSELLIDLRNASVPPVCELDIYGLMSNVRVLVPPEMVVECAVSPFMATVRDETSHGAWDTAAAPILRITGGIMMSELRVETVSRFVAR